MVNLGNGAGVTARDTARSYFGAAYYILCVPDAIVTKHMSPQVSYINSLHANEYALRAMSAK